VAVVQYTFTHKRYIERQETTTIHTTQKTIHRTTQKCLEQCGPRPVLASYTLAFALQLTKKHGKNLCHKNSQQLVQDSLFVDVELCPYLFTATKTKQRCITVQLLTTNNTMNFYVTQQHTYTPAMKNWASCPVPVFCFFSFLIGTSLC
jgi:hypothetical protein